MSSQQTIITNNNSLTPKRFKFVLWNASKGTLELKYIPDGWLNNEVEYKRDPVYIGVFRSISVAELTFFKEGRDFIQSVYELQGVDAEILVYIYVFNYSTNAYTTYHIGKIDLATYKINETGVSVQMVDNTFAEKFKNRDDVTINLFSTETINGTPLPPILDAIELTFRETSFEYNADWFNDDATPHLSAIHLVPMTLTGTSDFLEAQNQSTSGSATNPNDGFFVENNQPRTVVLTGSLDWIELDGVSMNLDVHIDIYENGVLFSSIGVATVSGTSGTITVNETFDILVGQSCLLVGEITSSGGDLAYTSTSLNLNETYTGTPEKTVLGITYFDALMRGVEIITDNNSEISTLYDIIDSDYFGTKERGYTTDGQLGFLTKGYYLREGWHNKYPLQIKFRELFETLRNVFNIGLRLDENILVFGRYNLFFENNVVIDISDRIRTADIEKSFLPEWVYNSVSFGYSSYSYDNTAGSLFEFNTKQDHSTVISSVKNQFGRVAHYRADSTGITKLLGSASVNSVNSEDVAGDEDIFMVDVFRSKDGDILYAKHDEAFSLVGGTIYANKAYNLSYSPARNLLRHGAWIKAGLINKLNTYLRWQSSEKNTQLFTQLLTETTPLYENADILVDDLENPLWYPEAYNVECPISYAEKLAIDANKHGLVKLSEDKYGWILELKTSSDTGMATMKLLRANLNFVTPVQLAGTMKGRSIMRFTNEANITQ